MKFSFPAGMTGFIIIWLGQLVSLLGTTMAGFALSIWAWQETERATTLALVSFFSFSPAIFLSPLAGVFIDRWNRKLTMMLSDLGAGSSTIITLVLYASGILEVWHLYVLAIWSGIFSTFQFPAYSAAISTMLPQKQYARASGMLALAQAGANIVAPALAGVLLITIGITGVLVIDIATFSLAILGLLVVAIPKPQIPKNAEVKSENLWQEVSYGFRYIIQRPSLFHLLLLYLAVNLIGALGMVMLAPLILARSSNDELALGSVLSSLGLGGVVGGLLMAVWGGPKRRVHGILLGLLAVSLFGYILIGLGQTLPMWLIGAFGISFFVPILSASNQSIWQSKVAANIQGKVFAIRQMVQQLALPVVMLLSGPLADKVFEPSMRVDGSLVPVFGSLVGTGPGAGIAVMFVLAGIAGMAIALSGYLFRTIRQVERLLPDAEA